MKKVVLILITLIALTGSGWGLTSTSSSFDLETVVDSHGRSLITHSYKKIYHHKHKARKLIKHKIVKHKIVKHKIVKHKKAVGR